MLRGAYSFACHQAEPGPLILSFLFIMTVVVPLSAIFIIISVLDLSSLSTIRSQKGRLFRDNGLCEHFYLQN